MLDQIAAHLHTFIFMVCLSCTLIVLVGLLMFRRMDKAIDEIFNADKIEDQQIQQIADNLRRYADAVQRLNRTGCGNRPK